MISDLSLKQQLEVKIDNLSYGGGRGVARHKGMVIFVPFVLPGETVRVQISKLKKSFAEADLIEILEPATERRPAPCPAFGSCGGCQWQHISYKEQLAQKNIIITREINRLRNFNEKIVHPIVPSPSEFNYRNRIQVHQLGEQIGFRQSKSHTLVNIDQCHIAEAALNKELEKLKRSPTKTLQRFEIFRDASEYAQVRNTNDKSYMPSFEQVNSQQSLTLRELVLQLCQKTRPLTLWDLYAGSGNLGRFIAENIPSINALGVELNQHAVKLGKEKPALINFELICLDIGKFLKGQSVSPDVVLLDPPRIGCDEDVINKIKLLKPKSLIYISCDLATLIRDLSRLETNYTKLSIYPIDMFPQTDYAEIVCVMEL